MIYVLKAQQCFSPYNISVFVELIGIAHCLDAEVLNLHINATLTFIPKTSISLGRKSRT